MAGKINNSPPPDADFGTVDALGRVKISPVWYRFLTSKQNAGEILVAGSVDGGVLSDSVSPPTLASVDVASFSMTAYSPSPDNEANRDSVASIVLPSLAVRSQVEVWAAISASAVSPSGPGPTSIQFVGTLIRAGAFNDANPGYSGYLYGAGTGASASFSTAALTEIVDAGGAAITYKLSAKAIPADNETMFLASVTLYLKTTPLS